LIHGQLIGKVKLKRGLRRGRLVDLIESIAKGE